MIEGRSSSPLRSTLLVATLVVFGGGSARAQFVWDGATNVTFLAAVGSNTLASGATLSITTGNNHDFSATALVNNGTVTWTAGYIRSGNSGSFTNNATFNDQNSSSYTISNPFGGSFIFTNAGTYNRTVTGTTTVSTQFDNTGTVSVSGGGRFTLSGGGTSSGAFNVSGTGSDLLINASYTLASGASLSGLVRQTGGTLTVTGTIPVSGFSFEGGALAGAQTFSSGALTWSGGNWNTGSSTPPTTTIASGATLNLSAANDQYRDFAQRVIVNNGTVNWSSGYIRGGNGSGFTNNGTFNDLNAPGYTITNPFGGSFTFTNNGTYVRNTTGTSYFDTTFDNNSAINLQQGNLEFRAGGTASAASTTTAASGTNVYFRTSYSLADGASLLGAGTYWLTSGTLTAAGVMNLGTFNQAGGVLAGTPTIKGTYNWSGGNWNTGSSTPPSATIASGATLNLSDANDPYRDFAQRAIVNNGTVNWNSGYIRGGNGSSFVNAAGATFNDFNASGYTITNPFGGAFTFTNNGTYTRNAGGTTYFDAPFDNNGAMNLLLGNFEFRAGGTLSASGTIAAASGTNVFFRTNYTIANGSSLSGAGTFWLTGGTLDVPGTLNVSTFKQTGGVLANTNTLSGLYTWSGGNWNTGSSTPPSTTIASGATLNLSDANDPYRDFAQRVIVNNGTVNWNSGYLRGGNGSGFTNNGTFNDLNAPGYTITNPFGGSFTFTNNGTYIRNTTGTSYFDAPFDNNGAINLQQGNLEFRAGGTLGATGTIAAANGTNVFFRTSYTVTNGAALSGAGNYWLTGGTFTVNGAVNLGSFNQTGGTMTGANSISGTFNWSGGNWNTGSSSPPTTTIASGGTLSLSDANDPYRDFAQRLVVNNGSVTWSSGYLRGGNGSTFTNNGTFLDLNANSYTVNNPFGGSFSFTSNGTYTRNAIGTSFFDVPFYNNGTLNLQKGDIQLRQGGTMGAASIVSTATGTHLYFTNNYTITSGAQFTGTGSVNQIGGTLTLDGLLTASAFLWSGGNWNAANNSGLTTTIASGTILNLTDANDQYRDFSGRAILDQGTVNWNTGYIRGGNGSTFVVDTGATFNDFNANSYTVNNPWGGSFSFTNNGTYNRSAIGTTFFDAPFNNNGTLNLQQGDIQLRQGGAMGATSIVNAASGTHLYITNNYSLLDGSQLLGAGLFNQIGGTLTFNGQLRASAFLWSGGNWNAANNSGLTSTIANGTVLNLTDANDQYRDFSGRAILNQGVVNWNSGYIRGGNGSTFTNAAGATFNDKNASSYTVNNPWGGPFTFVNNGTYVRNAAGTTFFDAPFNNNGTLNLQQGDLQLRQGGTMSATSVINASAGTHLYITNNYTLLTGAQLLGPGLFNQTGGTLTLDGTLTASAFLWSGGNWNAANSSGLTSTIGSGTVLNASDANDQYRDFSGRTIENQGVFNWNSGYLRSGNGGAFINQIGGVFNDQNTSGYSINNPWGGAFTFVNNGVYNHAVAGTSYIAVPFINNNGAIYVSSGTLRFQSSFQQNSGTIALANGATLQFDNGLNLAAGYLVGHGTVIGNVSSSQIISPSYQTGTGPGQLNITGNLTLQSTSALIFQLGGPTQGSGYDFLSIGGTAALNGTLALTMSNGFNLTANPASTFTILSSSALSGTFTNIANGARLNTSDSLGSFQVNYTATSVTLTNYIPIPEPSTWSLLALGLGALALGVRRRQRR